MRRILEPDLPPVLIDKIQIHQVVTNLIRNSIDALGEVERREIVICTRWSTPDQVEISVTDSGPGLAPFVTTKPDGMGIGLSICRSIVDAHGGRLWASVPADGGATFHIVLPASAEAL